jgi:SSS family solute:Na+ symporter
MYKAGMYTNSEYLEARFGPVARVLSSLVQVQYRTMVMANISTTLFLTFAVVGGLGPNSWWVVGIVIAMAISYTILGGSRSIAFTDSAQSVVMISASLVLFGMVWTAVGGWSGIESKLTAHESGLSEQLLHIGSGHVERVPVKTETDVVRQLLLGGDYDKETGVVTRGTPAWLVIISFIFVGMAYSIVNHEQSMRLFAAKSPWDMKMSVVVAGLLLMGITFFNLMMGIMGRALFPTASALPVEESLRQTADAIYPILVKEFTTVGWQGVVIAGLLAAAISTYAGIGAAMSALLTRDVYARLIVRNGTDRHYMIAGRWLTVAVVLGSLLYVPLLLRRGMMAFYLDLVATFVIPLLAMYLMGVFTRVHRKSGTIGLLVGVAYGVWRMIAVQMALDSGVSIMPSWMMNGFAAYPISFAITVMTMVGVSLVLGWEVPGFLLEREAEGWLRKSQENAAISGEVVVDTRSNAIPAVCGLAVLALGIVLSFVIFW